MDIGQIGDDGWTSVRTCWREELWLPIGLVVAALAYLLWIGISGAAVGFLADALVGGVSIDPWTGQTTFLVAVMGVLWVIGPAVLVALLVVDRVTNFNDNLRTGYRLRHPLLLFVPPVVVLAVGYATLVGTGSPTPAVLGLLLVGALWLAVRTTAYAYRVFSLSVPILVKLLLFATAVTVAVATLVRGGLAVGREPLVADALSGLAAQTGFPALATLHTATADVGGVAVPLDLAVAVAVPVGGSVAYVGIQLAWSLLTRVRRPVVRRPELRTGQRYPRFARPTTRANPRSVGRVDRHPTGGTDGATGSARPERASGSRRQSGGTGGGNTASAGGTADAGNGTASITGADGEKDDVTHTRVFTPPDDTEVASPGDVASTVPADEDREPTVADGDAGERYCPTCGERVEASATVCSTCNEDLAAE